MNHTPSTSAQGPRGDRARGQTRVARHQGVDPDTALDPERVEPALPHELDESARSQASGTPRHAEIGKQALADELSPSEDTDRGPVMDKVYHDKVATDRGHTPPRQ